MLRAQRPGLAAELIAALNQRSVPGLLALVDPEISIEVRGKAMAPPSNERLWKAVRLRGMADVQFYLEDFFRTLPSLHARAEEVRGLPCWSSVLAELAGVDNDGLPFAALALLRLRGDGRRLRNVTIEVLDIEVGPDLLTRRDRDPRRYFESFLTELSAPGAA